MEEIKKNLSKADFDKFRHCIEACTGIYIDDSKQNSFRVSLDNRMSDLGITDYSDYYSLLMRENAGRKEFDELLNLILIKETYFFRDERQLSVLVKNVLPGLMERKKGRKIKIWSAGCATGEEPYSLSMAIMENFFPGSIDFSIYATDICGESLRKAKEGIYPKSSMRSTDKTTLNKYFIQRNDRYYLSDQIKRCVCFDTVNLIEPFPFSMGNSFDIVFCRNVTIYFRTETIKEVIRRFYNVLSVGGYLFLGHSESLWQISDKFDLEEIAGVFLYRKNETSKIETSTRGCVQKKEQAVICQRASIPARRKDCLFVTTRTRTDSGEPFLPEGNPIPPPSSLRREIGSVGVKTKKSMEDILEKGFQPLGEEGCEELLNTIEELLQEDNKNIKAHLLAGKLYANMGLYDKALKKGMDVLEIDDLCAEAYVLTGCINYKTGEKEKAITSFKKAVYLDDKSVLSHYYLGNLYKDTGHIEQAIKEYKNVVRIFETHSESNEGMMGEVFTVKQLNEICEKNIELLTKILINQVRFA